MEERLSISEASTSFDRVIERARRGDSIVVVDASGEAVARVVPASGEVRLGRDLAERWKSYPHLGRDEAAAFAEDLEQARRELPRVAEAWD